jgi:hypothetical protein
VVRLAAALALFVAAAAPAPRAPAVSPSTRVSTGLADPALEPGIGRCTSDGVCTVTDSSGTRAATPLVLSR